MEAVVVSRRNIFATSAVGAPAQFVEWEEDAYENCVGEEDLARGEESAGEGIFSDDTGFCSAPDTEAEEEENQLQQLESHVRRNYESLLKQYCNEKIIHVADPFQGVNFMEMCVVLKLSAERSGFVKSAQLLDIILQLFARQVRLCEASVVKLVEEVLRHDKKGRKGKRQLADDTAANSCEDEGYSSQPLSQQSNHNDLMEPDEESTAPRRSSKLLSVRRKKSYTATNDQLDDDFGKELSAGVVARRLHLQEHLRSTTQNPYLDYQFDLREYYETSEEQVDLNLGQSAEIFLGKMGRFTNCRGMETLYLPTISLLSLSDEEDDELEGMDMDTSTPLENENEGTGMEIGVDVAANTENIQPVLNNPLSELVGDIEPPVLQAIVPLEELSETIDGENAMPVLELIKRKGKHKRKRMPLMDQQNIAEVGEVLGPPAKTARLDLEGEPVNQGETEEQNPEQLLSQQNAPPSSQQNETDPVEMAFRGENELSVNSLPVNGLEDQCSNEDWEFSAADHDGSFLPPSLLSMQDSDKLAFQSRTTRVDMDAIKCRFSEVLEQAQQEEPDTEVTFVEILQKAEVDILVGPDETIHSTKGPSFSQFSCSTHEVSIGVAFLAMLHNASRKRFYLVEDNQGAFKVTRQKPPDIMSGIDA